MKGTTVKLTVKTVSGYDAFGAPIYAETTKDVEDVLIGQPSTDDVTNALQLYGKKAAYTLGIPKGDANVWVDTTVEFWGEKYRTIGYPMTGESENIPLRWGQNVLVERYG